MAANGWVDEVLAFWFDELTEEDWFSGGADVDEKIRSRFLPLHEEFARAVPAIAYETADAALAAVLVFDQFSRNMFRKTPKAFATDPLALKVAVNAIDKGFDQQQPPRRRWFLFMPFMHSERIEDQKRCVELFIADKNNEGLKHAQEHLDIVARFGRFPHRNRTLGRESSAEERAFLEGHEGFGQ